MAKEYDEYILKPGTLLQGRYRIDRVIGKGGFGITYEAVNEKIDMTVAIKELYCREYVRRDVEESNEIHITYASQKQVFEQAKKRFLQEAKTLSGLSNESGIVKILDYFEENSTAYIVMEFLHGDTLDKYLENNGPLEWQDMLDMIKPLVATLERVHNRGIIHRDISASNIIVLEDGSLCLVDFGAVKDKLKSAGNTTTTVFTKQGYTPVEQYAQNGNIGSWSDVYALSAVCYECLTGVRPPDSLQRSIYDEYKTVKEMGKEIPERLEAILQKGLSVKAENRYANMNELLEALNQVAKHKKKRPKKLRIALLILCILAVSAGTFFYFSYRQEIALRFTETETFLVKRDKDASMDDFQKAFKTMEERLKILAGEEPYIWEDEGDFIRGVLPLACLGKNDPREILRDLVTRPGNWTINGVNIERKYLEKTGFTDGDKKNLEIRLTEDIPKDVLSDLKGLSNGKKVTLSVDVGYDNHISLEGTRNSSLSFSWDLSGKWKEKNARELFLYNIVNAPLDVEFDLYNQIQTNWETSSSGEGFGKKQTNIQELGSNTVSIEYWAEYSEDEITQGQITDFIISLKNRLDILDIPYALGKEKCHDKRIVIGVKQEDFNEDLFFLLIKDEYDLNIKDSWGQNIADRFTMQEFELKEDAHGNPFVSMQVDKDSVKKVEKSIKGMKERKVKEYFLSINDFRIFQGDISLWKGDTMQFDSSNLDDKKINQNSKKIVDLLNYMISERENNLTQYRVLAYQCSTREDVVSLKAVKTRDSFLFNREKEESFVDEIKKLSKDYEVRSFSNYEDGNEELKIYLPDNIYAESVLDNEILLKQLTDIMETCEMDQGTPWSKIVILVKSRYEKGNNAARISFWQSNSDKDKTRPYAISLIGYEEQESKWLKEISKKMKKDKRFQGYDIEFSDYSNYVIY